jgi:hypothetical protein
MHCAAGFLTGTQWPFMENASDIIRYGGVFPMEKELNYPENIHGIR